MAKLLILSGLPASGKSTYAEELVKSSGGQWVRVNKDLIRTMLHADKFTYANEKMTVEAEKAIARTMLYKGKNVIVDDTNLGERHENMWRDFVIEYNTFINEDDSKPVTFQKRRFKATFAECLRRNANRGYKVPQSAIHRMATQYKMIDGHWKDVVICDLDGTVADLSHRLHFIQDEKWDKFSPELRYGAFYDNEMVAKDSPIKETIDMVRKEYESGKTIIFVSGRSDRCRKGTEKWLRENIDFPWSALIMRDSKDRRPDTQVKKDFLRQVLSGYNIVRVYDDRPSVIRMWEEDGLEVVDCGDGIEF